MKEQWLKFLKRQQTISDREFLLSTVLITVAPTIAGLKPATLIRYAGGKRDLLELWKRYQKFFLTRIIPALNLEYFELNDNGRSKLGCFYQRHWLEKMINKAEIRTFFLNYGIRGATVQEYLELFKRKLEAGFPHEIGVLLGYPVEDVNDFIINKGENFLVNGYWKVYHHRSKAIQMFDLCDRAKMIIIEYFLQKWERISSPTIDNK